ncbi:MAG TPA: DipZ protein [Solirubrobacteraceae bacterium]|nr:DipZ protein [Solirubrobacteraceae bacterium]
MRAPRDKISAPFFPAGATWINVATLRLDQQVGRPVLVEFWDFCRANSLRTLGYMQAWHARFGTAGLRVISVHAGGYPPSQDPEQVRAAVARLGIEHPVLLDSDFALWREYGNAAWPARYLFDQRLRLFSMHYGEGAYDETQDEICELLGIGPQPLVALRPEDAPDALVGQPSPEHPGVWSGSYEAGAVWAVLEPVRSKESAEGAEASVRVNGRPMPVPYAGCHLLVEHERHTTGVLELEVNDGVRCHAVQFTAGLIG